MFQYYDSNHSTIVFDIDFVRVLRDTLFDMFKSVIAPIQAWLLSQGKCVGCGTELSSGKSKVTKYGEQVTCRKCGRIFIKKEGKFRRALLEEV